MTTREEVVAEALLWEGTPYHHHARIRGVGVDCANLPAAVYEACGLVERIDPEYSSQWFLHRDEEQFLSYIEPHAREIPAEAVGPGDLVVWKFGRTFSHSAIVLDPPLVLHAAWESRHVVRADWTRDSLLLGRPMKCYTLWGDE